MESFLPKFFVDVLNMSITASYAILLVFIARIFLKKAPKIFSYSLWSIVLFRLVCPISFSSAFSFLQMLSGGSGKMEYIPSNIGRMAQSQFDTGIRGANSAVYHSLPLATASASVNPMQIILFVLSMIWALGIVALMIYSFISYYTLKRRMSTSILIQDNIFEDETITSPFVLGVIKPKIYLPMGLKDMERSYILKHEKTHIRRLDYLIKPVAFLALCIHWFNPLVWVSFMLMTKDMEMSCDERVLRELGEGIKKDYSNSLLSLAANGQLINAGPLAFGEGNVRGRIKNVLNYKKTNFWILVVAIIAVAAVGAGLITNPKGNGGTQTQAFEAVVIKNSGASLIVYRDTDTESLFSVGLAEPALVGVSQEAIEKNDIRPGQLVKIAYNGEILAVYPAIISKCYKISVLGQASQELFDRASAKYEQFNSGVSNTLLQNLLNSGKKTKIPSLNDVPNVAEYKKTELDGQVYYVYEENWKYYVEKPYQSVDEITKAVYDNIMKAIADNSKASALEAPKIAITVGGTEINYLIGFIQWNGANYDRKDTFLDIMKDKSIADLPYIHLNKELQIEFKGMAPDSVSLQDYILKADGSMKYTQKEIQKIPIEFKNGKGTFVLAFNPFALLSSDSADYEPGASIRGFRLICNWGENECEYAFILRSDAR